MKFSTHLIAATIAITASFGAAQMANAQATFADKAVKQLEGFWTTTDGSRNIEFKIKNGTTPSFADTVRPGVTMTGGYGPGERGAAYVLEYPEKLACSYNIVFPSQERGNEMIMTLVRAEPKEWAHRCIVGTLKRSP